MNHGGSIGYHEAMGDPRPLLTTDINNVRCRAVYYSILRVVENCRWPMGDPSATCSCPMGHPLLTHVLTGGDARANRGTLGIP